jgi:hypothetical protein
VIRTTCRPVGAPEGSTGPHTRSERTTDRDALRQPRDYFRVRRTTILETVRHLPAKRASRRVGLWLVGVVIAVVGAPVAGAQTVPAPTGLVVTGQTETSVSLDWTTATFASGVDGYNVYVDGDYRLTRSRLLSSATVDNLRCGTSYRFGVTSLDRYEDGEGFELEDESPAAEITASTAACGPASASFDWTMPDRARDADTDGLLDISTTPAGGWAPSSFTVRLNACASTGGAAGISSYTWVLEGGPTHTTAACTVDVQVPGEKVYPTRLTLNLANGSTVSTTKDVIVQDRLVVVMGDSYASGEGNPDRRAVHGTSDVVWADQRCHRSGHAASARAALALERDDPKSSVTFLTLACSGGTLKEGVLGPYAGVSWYNGGVDSPDKLPPQIDQVAHLLGGRRIDDLVISIGGNDIGFAPVVTHCLVHGDCETHEDKKAEVSAKIEHLRTSADLVNPGYPTLRNAIQLKLNARTTYITQYPDFTTDANGNRCGIIGEDMHPLNGIDAQEAEWAATHVLGGLNGVLAAKVTEATGMGLDWRFVDGVSRAWTVLGQYGHGYCVGRPNYKTPTDGSGGRWVRTFTESCDLQGPATWFFGAWACQANQTIGTMHPNEAGQQALADRYLAYLRGNPPPVVLPDREAPTLAQPPDITRPTDPGRATAVVDFPLPSASDNVGVTARACSPAPGTVFAVGATVVGCVARDAAGNETRRSFTVTVVDGEAPSVTVPANITRPTDAGKASAVVEFTSGASDNVGVSSSGCEPGSRTVFSLGTTTVTCTARDAAGNQARKTFTVTVVDGEAPSVTVPADITKETDAGKASAVVEFASGASDNVGVSSSGCEPGSQSVFSLGTTTVTCTARDAAGNQARKTFTVTVVDREAPSVSVPADIVQTAPFGAPGLPVAYTVGVTDNVTSPSPVVACTPPSGSTFAPGTTTVTCTGTDAAGNSAAKTFKVTVKSADPPPPPPPPVVECRVPSLKGKTLPATRTALTKANCALGKVTKAYSPRVKKGRVIKQAPAAGRVLAKGAKVNVTLSKGPRP